MQKRFEFTITLCKNMFLFNCVSKHPSVESSLIRSHACGTSNHCSLFIVHIHRIRCAHPTPPRVYCQNLRYHIYTYCKIWFCHFTPLKLLICLPGCCQLFYVMLWSVSSGPCVNSEESCVASRQGPDTTCIPDVKNHLILRTHASHNVYCKRPSPESEGSLPVVILTRRRKEQF